MSKPFSFGGAAKTGFGGTSTAGGFGSSLTKGLPSSGATPNVYGSSSNTSTTSAASGGDGPYTVPFNSLKTPYQESDVDKVKVQNITSLPQFKNCTPEELRFYDYIESKKIEVPKHFKAETKGVLKAVAQTGSNVDGTKTTSLAAAGSKTTLQSAATSSTANSATNPKYEESELKFPVPKAGVVLTAAEYFKLKPVPIIREENEFDNKNVSTKYHRNYNSLFIKRNAHQSSLGYDFKNITPLKFSAEMLRCALPQHVDKQEEFAPIKTIPPLDEIQRKIQHFKIIRDGFADIQFLDEIDVSSINLATDIIIKLCFVNFYPSLESSRKPAPGKGLNVRTRITIYNAWPANEYTGVRQRFRPDQEQDIRAYEGKLQEFCASKSAGARFIRYDPIMGSFCFEIDNVANSGPYLLP